MSTQDTPVIDKPAVSSVKENDVALFTEDKPASTPVPEETKPAPETEGEKPAVESPEDGTKTPEEDGTAATPEGDKTPEPAKKEDGDLTLTLTDGSGLTQKDVDIVTAFAKENGLSKESAQKLLDSRAAHYAEFKNGQTEFLKTQQTKWLDDSKADKEIGGANWDQSVALAKMPIAKFASPGLKKMLDDSGLGNHPEVIKMFARIGKTMQPDTEIDAPKSPAAAIEKPAYEYLYGDEKK